MVQPDRKLDRKHTPFAKVVEGFDVVERAGKRKTVADHAPYQNNPELTGLAQRDLVVDPTIIHKVIVYRDGKALEHDFPLTDKEKAVTSVKDTPAVALADDVIHSGRRLRAVDAEGAPRRGLDVPYGPDDNPEEVDAKGEYKQVWPMDSDKKDDGKKDEPAKDPVKADETEDKKDEKSDG